MAVDKFAQTRVAPVRARPGSAGPARLIGRVWMRHTKSMDDVNAKLHEAVFYIERNPTFVKSVTSFPYIARSL
jgi:hypothetical protein